MSDAAAAAPAAAPAQGLPASASEGEAALFSNLFQPKEAPAQGSESTQGTGNPELTKGPQRGPDGKFLKAEGAENAATVNQPDSAEQADEQTPPDPAAKAEGQAESVELAEDIEEFAKQIGLEKSDDLLGHLKVKVGDKTVTLAEALKSYAPGAKEAETRLAEDRKLFEQTASQAAQNYQQRMSEVDALLGALRQSIGQEPDWNKVYAENSVEEYNRQRLQWENSSKWLNGIIQQRLQLQQKDMTELNEKRGKSRSEQQAKLLEKMPDWKDEGKRKEAASLIQDYAVNKLGLSPEEFSGIDRHEAYITFWEAAQWRALQAKKPEIEKKVLKLPPVLKPGMRAPKTDQNAATNKALIARLSRNPKDTDAGAALFSGLFKR